MPEDMPDRMPEDMPDRMPEDMSDRIPEDLPVTKCINVMVGITRSKVVFIFRALLTLGFHLFNEHFTGFHLLLAEPLARHGAFGGLQRSQQELGPANVSMIQLKHVETTKIT